MIRRLVDVMRRRSSALALSIDNRIEWILVAWLTLGALAALSRVALSSSSFPIASWSNAGSYVLLILAPVASTLLALRWFSDGHLQPQPTTRLARAGRWQHIGRAEAESHPLYGTGGIMISLMLGMMVSVPVRAAEYLAAMPPLPEVSPPWLSALHLALTLDVVLFTSLYMIAFVAALRRVPLFPRLLVAIWLGDLSMQLVTAQLVTAASPPPAVAGALHHLLQSNVEKVLVGMALWLPYLILATRVNVTYRHRIPA